MANKQMMLLSGLIMAMAFYLVVVLVKLKIFRYKLNFQFLLKCNLMFIA